MGVNITSRQNKLIMLLYNNSHLTIDGMAQIMDISSKTVRNDLVIIQEFIEENKLGQLVKKAGTGISLNMSDIQKQRTLEILSLQGLNSDNQYIDRKIYIIQNLFTCNDKFITINSLADSLFISKTSVQRILKKVEDWFSKFGIEIVKKQNRGISLEYDEISFRKCSEEFFYLVYNETAKAYPLATNNGNHKMSDMDLAVMNKLYKNFDFEKVINLIDNIFQLYSIDISQDYYRRIILQMCISIIRRRNFKTIPIEYISQDDIKESPEYAIASIICNEASSLFHLKPDMNETSYIAIYLLSSEFRIGKADSLPSGTTNYLKKIGDLADEVIDMLSNILDTNLSNDTQFKLNLLIFLRSAVYRLKYSITNSNPFLSQIKNLYPNLYGAAWSVSILFDRYYQLNVNENEIGYLCLHIGGALEKISPEIKVIIVCNYGVGVSHLMNQMLYKSMPSLKVSVILSSYEYKNYYNNDYDFVITTIDLPSCGKPILKVNSILTYSEVEKIKIFAKDIQKNKKYMSLNKYTEEFQSVFDDELIYWNKILNNKQQVIDFLCHQLVNQKCITRRFMKSVYDREDVISTEVGSMVALPHGNSKYVKKSRVAVLKLKEPIVWADQNKVDLIFMVAFSFEKSAFQVEEMKKFYLLLTRLLEDKTFAKSIRSLKVGGDFYKYVISNNFEKEDNI